MRLTDGADRAADHHARGGRPRARAAGRARSGGGPEENAERLKALLLGYGTAAERDAVALNAGALLMTAGKAATCSEGVELALAGDRLGRGAARVLEALVEVSNG